MALSLSGNSEKQVPWEIEYSGLRSMYSQCFLPEEIDISLAANASWPLSSP